MNLYWTDLVAPTLPSEWHGLQLTVNETGQPGFAVGVCPPQFIRITNSGAPLLWARIYKDFYGYELLRASRRRSPNVIAPISFRTVDENSRGDRTEFYRAWARTYAKMLAHSESSPLFGGRWSLGYDLRQSSHRELGLDALRRVVEQASHRHVMWDSGEAVYPIALRELSPRDDGRVHAWRKHARAGSLPPVILYWISGLCAHVILDGHDRALAASLENVPAPVLVLDALREREVDVGRNAVLDAVTHSLAVDNANPAGASSRSRSARRSLTVQTANRLLLNAFAPGLVAAPTRAAVMPGGLAAWSAEVGRELELQKLGDSTLLDGVREGASVVAAPSGPRVPGNSLE